MAATFGKVGEDISDDGPLVYRTASADLFVKRSDNPACKRVVKVQRPVGSTVYATGLTWRGPSGGLWAELDVTWGDMGWMLIHGPGFGLSEPALIDAKGAHDLVIVKIILLEMSGSGVVFRGLMKRDTTVAQVKSRLSAETKLTRHHCCLSKELAPPDPTGRAPSLGADYMRELPDSATLEDLKFHSNALFYLVYVGDFPDGWTKPEPIKMRERWDGVIDDVDL